MLYSKFCIQWHKLSPEGCPMGIVGIFMGWFEEKFIFPLLTNLSDFCLRFRDDIFLIWNGTKTEFDNFFSKKLMNTILASKLNLKYLKQK